MRPEKTRSYRIAIVDDREEDRRILQQMVDSWSLCIDCPVQTDTFASAEEFLFVFEDASAYDMLLLDIEMPGMNGVDLAKKIRLKDELLQIIFITGYSDYIAEGYDVSALHYLLKPVAELKLKEVLNRAAARIQKNEEMMTVVKEGEIIRIPLHDIRYVDVYSNYVTIHCKEEVSVKKTLSSMEQELDERFYRIGRSVIVNLTWIRQANREQILLKDGMILPIPRGSYDGLMRAIIGRL